MTRLESFLIYYIPASSKSLHIKIGFVLWPLCPAGPCCWVPAVGGQWRSGMLTTSHLLGTSRGMIVLSMPSAQIQSTFSQLPGECLIRVLFYPGKGSKRFCLLDPMMYNWPVQDNIASLEPKAEGGSQRSHGWVSDSSSSATFHSATAIDCSSLNQRRIFVRIVLFIASSYNAIMSEQPPSMIPKRNPERI